MPKSGEIISLLAWIEDIAQRPRISPMEEKQEKGEDEESRPMIHPDSESFLIVSGLDLKLRDLLREAPFQNTLARVIKKMHEQDGGLETVPRLQKFFMEAAWGSAIKHSPPELQRSELDRELKALSDCSLKLQGLLRALKPYYSSTASIEYLTKRHLAGNPAGFSTTRRGYVSYRTSSPTVNDLLDCFVADIAEERELLQLAVTTNRKSQGASAMQKLALRFVTHLAEKHLGAAFPTLVSEVVSKFRGTHIDSSAVAKAVNSEKND